jgi:hypothetical protein
VTFGDVMVLECQHQRSLDLIQMKRSRPEGCSGSSCRSGSSVQRGFIGCCVHVMLVSVHMGT